jgi:HAD superfamily hydrolase (TIGR01509 family)
MDVCADNERGTPHYSEPPPGPPLAISARVKLQAILLDIDGTLVDSNDKHADCWVEAFAHFGKKVEWDVVRGQIGKGGDLLVPDMLNAREMRRFGKELGEYRGELWEKRYMRTVEPFHGVKEALEEFHRLGLGLAFASSSNPNEVEYYVSLLGAEDLLEGSTSKGDAKISKPSPEIFQAALERVRTDPAETLIVGDTPYDVLAAHRAGIAVAALLCGGFGRDLLSKAEFLFDDIPSVVKELDRIDEYFAAGA